MNGRLWDHRRWPGVPHHSETRPAGAVGVSATTDPAPNSFPGCPAAWCKWPACGRDCPEKAANLSHIHHRIMERRRPARPRPRPLSRRSTPALSEHCHRRLARCRVSRGDYPVLKVPGAPILVPLAEFFSTFSTAWAPLSTGTGPRRWRRPQLGQSPSQLPSLSQLTVQVCPSPQLFEH